MAAIDGIVVIGAGMAGATAAEGRACHGWDGPIAVRVLADLEVAPSDWVA